jgi:hypothetical protein
MIHVHDAKTVHPKKRAFPANVSITVWASVLQSLSNVLEYLGILGGNTGSSDYSENAAHDFIVSDPGLSSHNWFPA